MFLSPEYVHVILALAPWVVLLAFSLEPDRHLAVWLPAGLLFSASVLVPAASVWAAIPWLLVTLLRAGNALARFRVDSDRDLPRLAHLFALLYLPVGGVWALLYQLRIEPLGFPPIIVLLTAVHFHYAGFALPTLTGLWLRRSGGSRLHRLATVGVIGGVPMVALGITSSQLALPFWIETAAVTLLALSALVVRVGQVRWALGAPIPLPARLLFCLGGLALAAGMVLALMYGWRHLFPREGLTVPVMYAAHGSLNSLGFCLPGFVAWKLVDQAPTAA